MTAKVQHSNLIRAVLWIGVVAGMWGLIERLGMAIADTYHFSQIVNMRYAVHLVVLFLLWRSVGARTILKSRHPYKHLLLGFCMLIMPLSFILGTSGQTGANLWGAFWSMPLFILALSSVVLGDKVGPGIWAAAGVGYVGALLVLEADLSRLGPAGMIPAIGGLSFAAYVVLLRQLRDEPVATNLFYSGLVPFIGMMPLTISVWQPIQAEDVWRIVAIGIVGLTILYSLDRAMHFVPPWFAAPLLFGAVVSEPLIELLRTGAVPDSAQVTGSLILLAVGLTFILIKSQTGLRHG